MYQLTLSSQLIVVLLSLFVSGNNEYENKLTKLWSLSSAKSDNPRTAVVNVTSASIVIQPTSYSDGQYVASVVPSRQSKMPKNFGKRYAFKPRAIPLSRAEDQASQVERSIHYTEDANKKQKTEILFPGNYFKISDAKRQENSTENTLFNPLDGVPFHPKIIPLMRDQQFRRRSLVDVEEEPTIEKPNGYVEPSAMRRSISYLFGVDDEEDEEDGEEDVELDLDTDSKDEKDGELRHKIKRKKFKIKRKYAKYMLPLLLAYKLKFFALVPLMMGGLILLVGATGMAGFFFALFAAVMGLQKGSY